MEKDNIILNQLVNLAHAINNEYYNLMYYEDMNIKNTKNFGETIKNMEKYILIEIDTYQEIDSQLVIRLLRMIPEDKLDSDDDYIRVYRCLSRRYLELSYNMIDNGEDIDISREINNFQETMEWDTRSRFRDYLEEYDVDNYRYLEEALTVIYVRAIKGTLYCLENTTPTNSSEENLARDLINNFKIDKYSFFTRDNSVFEMLGILYQFDPKIIPDYTYNDNGQYQDIYYNECLFIIRDIYSMINNNDENINMLLFLSLCLYEMIKVLDKERINNIERFILELDDSFRESFYMNNITNKIRIRKKSFNK